MHWIFLLSRHKKMFFSMKTLNWVAWSIMGVHTLSLDLCCTWNRKEGSSTAHSYLRPDTLQRPPLYFCDMHSFRECDASEVKWVGRKMGGGRRAMPAGWSARWVRVKISRRPEGVWARRMSLLLMRDRWMTPSQSIPEKEECGENTHLNLTRKY